MNVSNLTQYPELKHVNPPTYLTIFALVLSFTTVFANLLVIFAFIYDKKLQKYSNYFMLNLSIADLLIGILMIPYVLLGLNENGNVNGLVCTVWLILDYVGGSASVLCIVVISLDRYLIVSRGIKYIANQKIYHAFFIIVTVWGNFKHLMSLRVIVCKNRINSKCEFQETNFRI